MPIWLSTVEMQTRFYCCLLSPCKVFSPQKQKPTSDNNAAASVETDNDDKTAFGEGEVVSESDLIAHDNLLRGAEQGEIQFQMDTKVEGSDMNSVFIQNPGANQEEHEVVYSSQVRTAVSAPNMVQLQEGITVIVDEHFQFHIALEFADYIPYKL